MSSTPVSALPATDRSTSTSTSTTTAMSPSAQLSHLRAAATKAYSLKSYDEAAELYSTAAELQDQLNGEMSPENADLLYLYGRCLYHVAVGKSDVLGGKVAGASSGAGAEEPRRKKRKIGKAEGEGVGSGAPGQAVKVEDREEKLAGQVVEAIVEEKDGQIKEEAVDAEAKPYFQITGDENFTDSEDGEDAGEVDDDAAADAEAEEEEDDFATAFEVLDMARILLGKQLAALSLSSISKPDTVAERRLHKERLADTHDLQAEISLENERFHDAIKDTRDALELKLELYPAESSLIAEAHFKLSLALEFASVTAVPAAVTDTEAAVTSDQENDAKPTQVHEPMRAEAALEMEKAITSCTLRIKTESALLSTLTPKTPKHADQTRSIADVKEMVEEMQQRLLDLRKPASSLAGPSGPAGVDMLGEEAKGVLGELLGESKGEQARRLGEAVKGANDLSGLVKRKKVKVEDGANGGGVDGMEGKRKRKAGSVDGAAGGNGKKVKFENGV